MRRLVAIALLLIAVPLVLVFGIAAGGSDGGGYKVRAIFDFVRLVPGEDVKIAGAKVGKVESLDVTPDKKAAVVLSIDKDGFTPFHADAHCTIRPQSLIGETFADCTPGTFGQPELKTIPDGEKGAGQHLLPVQNTSSPVDIDEINDIYREPIQQRLAIVLNEFGAGLAGRGQDLNDVIHRANPALRETDKVLAVLASQNRTLADLARSSDRVLAPLAAKRDRFAHFIVAANQTNQATAAVRGDIQASIERFPAFLRQFEPTLRDLGALADQATPVVTDLGTAAPGINKFIKELGPFSKASIPALESLGDATDVGRPALTAALPVVNDLRQFGTYANPVSVNLDKLTKSLKDTKAVDALMDNIFYTTTAINGFDSVSHYLRAALIVNTCASYDFATAVSPGCSAKWADEGASTAAAAASATSVKDHGTPPRKSLLSRILSFSSAPSGSSLDGEKQAAIQRVQKGAGSGSSQALGANDPVLKYLLGN
jgi:virulence factor Mce-like protein